MNHFENKTVNGPPLLKQNERLCALQHFPFLAAVSFEHLDEIHTSLTSQSSLTFYTRTWSPNFNSRHVFLDASCLGNTLLGICDERRKKVIAQCCWTHCLENLVSIFFLFSHARAQIHVLRSTTAATTGIVNNAIRVSISSNLKLPCVGIDTLYTKTFFSSRHKNVGLLLLLLICCVRVCVCHCVNKADNDIVCGPHWLLMIQNTSKDSKKKLKKLERRKNLKRKSVFSMNLQAPDTVNIYRVTFDLHRNTNIHIHTNSNWCHCKHQRFVSMI